MKNTIETKLKAVKEHVENHETISTVCNRYGLQKSKLKYLTALYRLYGEEPFIKNREGKVKYSRELKLEMIKRNLEGESGYKLALELKSVDQTVVRDWRNLYLKNGESGIHDSHTRKSFKLKNEREHLKAHKKILARNEYLEAENEVLKKWCALILQRSEKLRIK